MLVGCSVNAEHAQKVRHRVVAGHVLHCEQIWLVDHSEVCANTLPFWDVPRGTTA